MDESIGLRIYVAGYITAGVVLGTIGSFFGSLAGTSGDLVASVLGGAMWIGLFFVGVVVALKGVVVLIEELIRSELSNQTDLSPKKLSEVNNMQKPSDANDDSR